MPSKLTPLMARVRDVLDEHGPLRVEQIRRELRRGGQNARVDRIERLLKEHDDLFRPAGAGGWDLAERQVSEDTVPVAPRESAVDPVVGLSLIHI